MCKNTKLLGLMYMMSGIKVLLVCVFWDVTRRHTLAGTIAAGPIPCKPLNTSSEIMFCEKPHPREKAPVQIAPRRKARLRP